MPSSPARNPRRSDALSRERIVEAAIDVLDSTGESGLTFRGLAAQLSTGPGAIYHHLANKDEILAAATDRVIGEVAARAGRNDEPLAQIRELALAIFDAIDEHPWVGTQLSGRPLQPAVLRIWNGIGTPLAALGISGPALSDAGAALVNYVLGAAAQYAAGSRNSASTEDRQAFLDSLAATWDEDGTNPIAHDAARQLSEHNDRDQFLAGVNIFLAGITA